MRQHMFYNFNTLKFYLVNEELIYELGSHHQCFESVHKVKHAPVVLHIRV